jgi:hypothetical protein
VPVPHGGQQQDGVRGQPAGGEDQRLGGRQVQEVGVVDQDRERLVLGEPAEQAQGRRADGEPVATGPRPQGQGRRERVGLRGGDPVEMHQRGSQQLEQPAEGDLRLRLRAGGPEQPHAGGRRRGVLEQRALADAHLAGEHQDTALPDPGGRQQPVDQVPLAFATDQHPPSLGSAQGGALMRRRP